MKKLIRGMIEFRRNVDSVYRQKFAHLALGQSPDTLFISCSDSRVAVNVFASTDPGDLFVIRNVGNMIPECGEDGRSATDESEAAAIEFAILNLKVKDIIVCGHSECGAMIALLQGRESVPMPNLRSWLRHGEHALAHLGSDERLTPGLSDHNKLSQLNVLEQLKNLKTYPIIRERLKAGTLHLHGLWFELARACVHTFDPDLGRFVEIDEAAAERILKRAEAPPCKCGDGSCSMDI